jgi:sigma-B regulation protein RsbU (phosphoserine phosphatase)
VLTYCNGGHCPPYRWSPARGARPLERHGHLPLGIDADERYEDRQTVLEEGERLVLYSDGITEAENARGEWFREERLRKALEEAGGSDPRPLAEEIRRRVHDFAGEQPQSDDIAILVLKFGELHHKSPENA